MSYHHPFRTQKSTDHIWDLFFYFENEQTTRNYLLNHYNHLGLDSAQGLAYRATPKLIYSMKQAREYFKVAKVSDVLCKPLLIYYGMMSLARALITTVEPDYPTNTSVLKHGLSSRKRKKENYEFVQDEVRVQKDGVFLVLHQAVGGAPFSSLERFQILDLLSVLPDLRHSYKRLYGPSRTCEVQIFETESGVTWDISRQILQTGPYTKQEFLNILNQFRDCDGPVFELKESSPQGRLQFFYTVNENISTKSHPLLITDTQDQHCLCLPVKAQVQIPEISVHFMITFILGMLCRYEIEKWGELILSFQSQDLFIINEFLNLTMHRFPSLILEQFQQQQHS